LLVIDGVGDEHSRHVLFAAQQRLRRPIFDDSHTNDAPEKA
jgi:hypothetical protein